MKAETRAFTLMEIAVAVAMSVVVVAVASNVMVDAMRDGRRSRVHSEMSRDAALVGQLFSQELRQAGLGVPNAGHISSAYGTTANSAFYASVIVAADQQVGIVGDLPRPDANYSAYGPLHNRALSPTHVMWHTENNGACAPDALLGSCQTGVTSLFFPGEDGCDSAGAGAFFDRTCPWGLRRVLPGERLILVSGDGRWAHVALDASGSVDADGALQVLAARLGPGFVGAWPQPPPPSVPVSSPAQVAGQGWVSSLDRVFFKFDSTTRTIQRQQCSGDPDPDNVNWPNATAVAIPASTTFTPLGGALNVCGPFEVVARHVDQLTLGYFDSVGGAIATPVNSAASKLAIRRISYRIRFKHNVDGREVIHDVAGSVRLQNL